jgi:hypothetical protein
MIHKLYEFQNKYLTYKSKFIIKSIESGLFTGIRNTDGNLKDQYIKYYNNNIDKYNTVLDEIKGINKSFFELNPYYKNEPIYLYRGIQSELNNKYIDYIPSSYSYNKDTAMGFIIESGTLLKYICLDKSEIILNCNSCKLNEYEIILPPQNYIIKNKTKHIYNYIWKNNKEKFWYNKVDIQQS